MSETAKEDSISAIAAILAKGFLRYRKSRRILPDSPPHGLASGPEPSRHVTVVNDQRTDEK